MGLCGDEAFKRATSGLSTALWEPGQSFLPDLLSFSALYLLMQATIPYQPGVNNNPPEQGEVRNLPNR